MSKREALPAGLSDAAKASWPELQEQMRDGQIKLRGIALRLFCESFARWKDANEQIAKFGAVIKAPSGYVIQSPFIAIANRAQDQMVRIMARVATTSTKAKVVPQSEKAIGKKEQRLAAATVASASGKFATSQPPKLVVNNRL